MLCIVKKRNHQAAEMSFHRDSGGKGHGFRFLCTGQKSLELAHFHQTGYVLQNVKLEWKEVAFTELQFKVMQHFNTMDEFH